ncbi:uncharacterized protein LOC125674894 [Ostrea edulis]|uniref:uncharacterized protein LOC125674894 n=1 Tax=Ostrea edulis TaxID=37623 RepID=UPI0024AF5D0B|nr:uncharacterized protein LOC125674894 [Ostrea edulis]
MMHSKSLWFLLLIVCNIVLPGCTGSKYVHFGCIGEAPHRILRAKAGKLKPNSPWHCQQFCKGYTYFGVQYSHECFCGNNLHGQITPKQCTMPCAGNGLLRCGGSSIIDVYISIN